MLEQFEKTEDPSIANSLAHICSLAPGSITDLARAVRIAERTVTREPKNPAYLNTLGAALYRAGRFKEAVERLEEAITTSQDKQGSPSDWLFLAMANHDLGNDDEARKRLDQAIRWIDARIPKNSDGTGVAPGLTWSQVLELQILLREARSEVADLNFPADPFAP